MIKYLPILNIEKLPILSQPSAFPSLNLYKKRIIEEPDVEDTILEGTYTIPKKPVVETSTKTEKESKRYTDANEFISDLYTAYSNALSKRGIDPSYAYMLVAQDALESAYGSKYTGNYNYGNITAIKNQDYTEGKDKDGLGNVITQRFRNYNSLDEWVNAKIDLLSGKRYKAFAGNPEKFYDRVKAGGYATDPKYVEKLQKVYKGIIKAQRGTKLLPKVLGMAIKEGNKIQKWATPIANEELFSGIDLETLTPQHVGFNPISTSPIVKINLAKKSTWDNFLSKSEREQNDLVKYWNGEKYSTYKNLSYFPKDLEEFQKWLEKVNNKKKKK